MAVDEHHAEARPVLDRSAVAVVEGAGERAVALTADQEFSRPGDGFVMIGGGFGGRDDPARLGVEDGADADTTAAVGDADEDPVGGDKQRLPLVTNIGPAGSGAARPRPGRASSHFLGHPWLDPFTCSRQHRIAAGRVSTGR